MSQAQHDEDEQARMNEEEMLRQAIAMSEAQAKLDKSKMSEEEYQFQLALEKSRLEAEAEEALRKKNNALLKTMEEIESSKPQGWGFKAKAMVDGSEDEKFNQYQDNLHKAI